MIPILILVVWKRQMVLKWLARLAGIFPAKLRDRLLNFLDKGMEAFSLLRNVSMTLRVVLITGLVILSQVITNLLLFRAYGFNLSFFEALILQVILIIGMSLPSVPGKVGVFEYTVVLALSMFGIGKSVALSYALLGHVIAYLPKIILGFLFMASLNISIKKTEAEINKFEGEVIHPDEAPEEGMQ
jgi:uncharacterized protein (TIRG00374 family)